MMENWFLGDIGRTRVFLIDERMILVELRDAFGS
jgi:hypothetical protein